MNRLYPLKFKPIIKDKIWGGTRLKTLLNKRCKTDKAGESWEISGYPGDVSKVKNGFLAGNSLEELIEVYMGDLVGDSVFEKFGTLFPLLIKFIDANDILSVQVHPDDKLAREKYNASGKTEMWYVLESEKDAEIITGFNQKMDKDLYVRNLNDKSLLSILNIEKTVPGDVFFLPAGRIHAIGAGVLLTEIQQTSDMTFRIYDFDRVDDAGNRRELHTDQALEAIDFKLYPSYKTRYQKAINATTQLVTCKYFTTNIIEFDQPVNKDYYDLDSFVVYICLEGEFDIRYHQGETEKVKKGETVLMPSELANVQLVPVRLTKLLEVYIEGESLVQKTDALLERLF